MLPISITCTVFDKHGDFFVVSLLVFDVIYRPQDWVQCEPYQLLAERTAA